MSGHHKIYPTQYILLHGLPATRKTSAITIGTNLLKAAGYKRFAPSRMSRQAFAMEMYAMNQPEHLGLDLADMLSLETDYPYEMTAHAGEFLDFIGQHDLDYLSLLTTLWDNPDEYDNPKANGKAVRLHRPTVNLLGASTPKNMSIAFPATAMDTGNLSRMIFVYADPVPKSARMLTPEAPSSEAAKKVTQRLIDIGKLKGEVTITKDAEEIMNYIYMTADDHPDPRLQYYSGRRVTHLWKLAMISAAMRNSLEISEYDVISSNSYLAVAEHTMSSALGNFGRSRQSAITHDIVEWLRAQGIPLSRAAIYRNFSRDFSGEQEFQAVMDDLTNAGWIVHLSADGKSLGYTTMEQPFPKWLNGLVAPHVLTQAERDIAGLALEP